MKGKQFLGLVLALAMAVNSLGTAAVAVKVQEGHGEPLTTFRASGSFSMTISAGKYKKIDSTFSLRNGEIVKFEATYTPRTASVDFGVLDSNNHFTYITASNGSVNGYVTITKSGTYTPAVRNNSSNTITVSGNVVTGVQGNYN